ncbi:plasmid partition protein ParG [Leptolyngbya sp. CCNP1308]|uniref:plasmid partition protein ParG n=1 Tax=Leptolyngbya sp. CCNP1308 TaxID=3110255 RepID=UPI002B209C30|nr:plasmid partition protein ParG [Leptolyngbya sp. CCNP1308]MEA5452949.1 plasmid partition protein ParG [Leptolyngbya sp. CCNP1308]
MSDQNRFANLLKAAQQQPEIETPVPFEPLSDVQTSEHPDTQAPKQPDISTSKAKSSSSDYKRTTVYLTQELHRRLKRASLDEGMEMSDIAESAIAAWLEEHSDV